jgi:CheY-like chemotaxis protein
MPTGPPVVLLVDNHQDSLAMYAFALLALGFEPVVSQTAEDGFVRACQLHPAVIVTDVTLAGRSGIELTRQVRNDDRTRNTGVIVLTGRVFDSIETEARDAGCDRFLRKPCLPDALALAILDVISARHRGGTPSDPRLHTQL